jgi:hypothetical protein
MSFHSNGIQVSVINTKSIRFVLFLYQQYWGREWACALLNKTCLQHVSYLLLNFILKVGSIPIRPDMNRSGPRDQRYRVIVRSWWWKGYLRSKNVTILGQQVLNLHRNVVLNCHCIISIQLKVLFRQLNYLHNLPSLHLG